MNELVTFYEENKLLILIILGIIALMIFMRLLSTFLKDLIYVGSIFIIIIKAIFKFLFRILHLIFWLITSPWQLWKLYKEIKMYNSFIVNNAKLKDVEVL